MVLDEHQQEQLAVGLASIQLCGPTSRNYLAHFSWICPDALVLRQQVFCTQWENGNWHVDAGRIDYGFHRPVTTDRDNGMNGGASGCQIGSQIIDRINRLKLEFRTGQRSTKFGDQERTRTCFGPWVDENDNFFRAIHRFAIPSQFETLLPEGNDANVYLE